LACLLLASCGLTSQVTAPDLAARNLPAGRPLNIRIERWEKLRFSGLLGLRETAGGLAYVVLDATGIKLLQAEVAGDGSFVVRQISGPLEKTGLAPFLSEALARIYLQEPDRLPCAGSWFYRLCREGGDGSAGKYGQAGPFTVWRVSGHAPGAAGDGASVYEQPWLGVTVRLEPVAGQ
jgi:hypothetical protein